MTDSVNSIGFSLILILSILFFCVPRRFVFLPMLIPVCYVSMAQVIVIGGLHFSIIRILVIVAFARLLIRREIPHFKRNTIDNALIYWLICGFLASVIRDQTVETLINRLGFVFDGFFLYFFFRFIIRDLIETEKIIMALLVLSIPLAIEMAFEYMSGWNLFSIFGGAQEYAWVRDEAFRAQGPFRHSILAGTFGATMMPFFVSMWFSERPKKFIALIGVSMATLIVMSSHSSSPLLSYLFGIIGMAMWRIRDKMRIIRWGITTTIIFLAIIMKAPVWYLIARMSDITGGTGWHRSYLIDQAVAKFGDWWFLGTSYTAHWMPYGLVANANHADITNNFIQQGIDGGILTLFLFILVIIFCFKTVGIAIRCMEDKAIGIRMLVWAMGVSLLAHIVSFLSITYFDQMIVIWYMLLAMISNIRSIVVSEHSALSDKLILSKSNVSNKRILFDRQ